MLLCTISAHISNFGTKTSWWILEILMCCLFEVWKYPQIKYQRVTTINFFFTFSNAIHFCPYEPKCVFSSQFFQHIWDLTYLSIPTTDLILKHNLASTLKSQKCKVFEINYGDKPACCTKSKLATLIIIKTHLCLSWYLFFIFKYHSTKSLMVANHWHQDRQGYQRRHCVHSSRDARQWPTVTSKSYLLFNFSNDRQAKK